MCVPVQVKQGAENLIDMYGSGQTKDKKMLTDAQQMLDDSKRKVNYIRMQILKLQQQKPDGSDSELSLLQ